MQAIKIFGEHNFEIHEPFVGSFPAFLEVTWRSKLSPAVLVQELCGAQAYRAAEDAIRRYADRAEQAVLAVGRGFYAVKAGKGKTDKSMRVEIECRRGREPDAPTVVSSFYAPTSLVLHAPLGPRARRDAFLSTFFVRQKLKEVANRAQYKWQNFERVPVAAVCWPPHLKQEFLDSLLSQLPTGEAINEARRAIENEREIREAQRVELCRMETQEREIERVLMEKQRANRAAARARRNAKMEVRVGVNVKWRTWTRVRGVDKPIDGQANDVSVRTSGAASYVIFPDGRELRVATKNLDFL